MRRVPATLIVLVTLPWAACLLPPGGEGHPPLEPTFASLDANVFRPQCTGPCHSGGEEFAGGGLDMEPDARLALIDVLADSSKCRDSGMTLVVPAEPEESLAYIKVLAKLDDTDPPCGDPMPPQNRAPLTQAQADTLRLWISRGAPD